MHERWSFRFDSKDRYEIGFQMITSYEEDSFSTVHAENGLKQNETMEFQGFIHFLSLAIGYGNDILVCFLSSAKKSVMVIIQHFIS